MRATAVAKDSEKMIAAFGAGRLWAKLEKWPWRGAIQRGLAPVSVGLVLSGAISLAGGALTGWLTALVAVAVFAAMLRTRINPALLILCGALIGLFTFRGQ